MPRPSLNNIAQLADPLLSYNYLLKFTEVPSGIVSTLASAANYLAVGIFGLDRPPLILGGDHWVGRTSGLDDGAQGFETDKMKELTLRCSSVSVPSQTIEQVQVDFQGYRAFYPGKHVEDNVINVEFVESQHMTISKAIFDWMEIARSQKDGKAQRHKHVSGYLGKMILASYAHDGTTTSNWIFNGVWPTARADVPFSGETADLVKVSVSFAYHQCMYDKTLGQRWDSWTG